MERSKHKKNWVFWTGLVFLLYFVFSGILGYMKASGIEVYVIKYDVINHRVIFEHIIDDGEHGNKSIEEEIDRND